MFQALNTSVFQDVVCEAREAILSLHTILCKLDSFFLSPPPLR